MHFSATSLFEGLMIDYKDESGVKCHWMSGGYSRISWTCWTPAGPAAVPG